MTSSRATLDHVTPAAVTAAVSATDVTKTFSVKRSQVPVLHGISLSVNCGEMVSVMGPSGSGKSTLLYCLAGLERPDTGSVRIDGQDLSELSRSDLARMRRSRVGFVFQSYNLVPTLTAADNVALPYLLAGEKPPEGLAEQTLAEVGLEHRITARPPSMSGGEQQRVALARVLAQRPGMIFADEPTGALDTRSGALVLDKLTEVAHRPQQAVLLVTHDPGVAAHSDRVIFMRDGHVVDEVRPEGAGHVASVLTALTDDRGGSC